VYGWQWECPNNGDDCKYTHALPLGYVLNRDKQAVEEVKEDEDEMTLEEKIEEERAALPSEGLTRVTYETFMAWKEKKKEEREKEKQEKRAAEAKKAGKSGHNVMSGRALFKFDPNLFVDDEGAYDAKAYDIIEEEKEEEDQKNKEKLYGDDDEDDGKEEKKEDGKFDEDLFRKEGAGEEEEPVFD